MRWARAGRGRANALDVGRGLAILCVLYGHALAPWFMGGDPFHEEAFLQWKFGAAFMMAFFFFISGMGWRERRSLETTFRQAIALVLIAWIASIALDLLRYFIGIAGFSAPFGYQPFGFERVLKNAARTAVFGDIYSMSALWFLVALAVTRVAAAVTYRAGVLPAWGAAFLLLGATLASTEFGWRNFYQLNLIGVAVICFLAGHALRFWLKELERWPRATLALCVLSGAATAATFHLNQGCRWDASAACGLGWLGDRFGVSMIIGQFGNLTWFTITTITGVTFALCLSVLLARFGARIGEQLSSWGRASIDLLIANCVLLQLSAPAVGYFISPYLPADNAPFFVGLFIFMLAANL
ncbi:MAG TPA: acyltransferase family protein, partial [Terricaulis sp.]|nr:acyltransferase family protein [Terricaulis sp.]